MKTTIKAVFFDIDGTLIHEKDHKISEQTEAAIKKLKEDGIKIFIATGRHMEEICYGNLLGQLAFDGFVTLNGQYCFTLENNQETVIHQHPIEKEDIKNLTEYLEGKQLSCVFLEAGRMYANLINEVLVKEHQRIGTVIPPVVPLKDALKNEILQVIPFVLPEEEAKMLSLMKHCETTRWSDYAVDVIPKGGSKKMGIQKVLEWFQINREETMAFGDGFNDVEMLSYVGIGIAMGNAKEEVKKYADYITDCVEENGVAKALNYFGLF